MRLISKMRQGGFTYLAVLFIVAAVGVLLWKAGEYWSFAQQREKERELLYIGHQFRNAIASYYIKSPGTVKRYPENIENLLEDKRYLTIQRHLRKVFVDPMTTTKEWGLVPAPSGGIMGVYSRSEKEPIKVGYFAKADADFVSKTRYSEWKFIYVPAEPGVN